MTQNNLGKVSVESNQYEFPLASEPITTPIHTYHPTSWPFVNKALDMVDNVSKGRAGQLQRFISFAFLGGIASLVNLVIFYVIDSHTMMSTNESVRFIIAFLIATEISIVVNFSLNDYFTFRHLPGHVRSWRARCARFHTTAISGTILTFAISALLASKFNVSHTLAQAIAILIVLFYNFAAHHFFTYRHVKTIVAN